MDQKILGVYYVKNKTCKYDPFGISYFGKKPNQFLLLLPCLFSFMTFKVDAFWDWAWHTLKHQKEIWMYGWKCVQFVQVLPLNGSWVIFNGRLDLKGGRGLRGRGGWITKSRKWRLRMRLQNIVVSFVQKKIYIYDEECREFMSLSSLRHSCLLSPHAHTKRWTDYLLCCAVKTAKCHRSSAVKAQVAYCSRRSRHFRVWLEGTLSHLALKIRSIPGTFSGLRFILLEFRKGRYRILKDK